MVVDARIAERRRLVLLERKRRRLHRTLALVALLAVAAALAVIERSPLVALAEVRVAGTSRLDPAAVRAAAALAPGTSILRLDLSAAERRVEALPLVATAETRRVDPLTVLVAVTEREPRWTARTGDASVLVDDDGTVIERGSDDQLPVVVLPPSAQLPTPGEQVAALPALANAVAALDGLSGPLAAQLLRAEATAADELTLVFDGGLHVRVGRADRMAEKVRALGAVLAELDGEPAAVIDVRAPATPVLTP